MSQILRGGLQIQKMSDQLTWNDPTALCLYG